MKRKSKIIALTMTFLATLSIGMCYHFRDDITDMVKAVNCKTGRSETNDLESFLCCKLNKKSVVIFEPNPHHHECIPGYAKYFMDLGYSVDILLIKGNEDVMCLFEPDENLRIFTYDDIKQISENKKLRKRFDKYDFVLINTTDPDKKEVYENLGAFENKNSLFVAHDITWVRDIMKMQSYIDENRVITLGNFTNSGSVYVNPHYFGKVPRKDKNKKIRFFMTSTCCKTYEYIMDAVKTLKQEKLDFEVIVTGRSDRFNENIVPDEIKDKFIFRHNLSYKEMYKEIIDSDYIIINFDSENKVDNKLFRNIRVTGSAQLSYGFLKPSIIHSEFANNYSMTNENSILYDNKTLTDALRKAINSSNSEYKEMQDNLLKLEENIYKLSLENLKKAIKYID